MYRIKTRNWNAGRVPAILLSIIAKLTGATCYKSETDLDHKYFLETFSPILAWLTWGLFMSLRRWSGGWTYIVRPKKELDADYRAIY